MINSAAIYAASDTATGGDIDTSHNGVIDLSLDVAMTKFGGGYNTSAGFAIWAEINDNQDDETRADDDIRVELGRTGVIRQLAGNEGMGGIAAYNRAEDGDITINLARGSLIDMRVSSGAPVVEADLTSGNAQTGTISVNAAGTIYTRITGRGLNGGKGVGISIEHDGVGDTRIASSGIMETMQAPGIHASARGRTANSATTPGRTLLRATSST